MEISLTRPTILGFIGVNKWDILTFLAMCLSKIDMNILLVNQTEENYLNQYFSTMADQDSNTYVEHIENVTFSNDFFTEDLGQYDICIVDFGTSIKGLEKYCEVDWAFIVSDLAKSNVIDIKNQLRFIEKYLGFPKKIIAIYKDLVPCKIDRHYLEQVYHIGSTVNILTSYEFPWDSNNYCYDLLNQYNQQLTFKGISKPYQQFVSDVMEEVTGKEKDEIRKAMKKAIRGK